MTQQAEHQQIRIAALQPALAFGQARSNLALIRRTVEDLVADVPLDVVVLPEVFTGEREATDGSEVRPYLQSLARDCDTHVIGGSCPLIDDDGQQSNACFVVHRSGREVGRYDKRVLFSRETQRCQPGANVGVFELDSIRVGVLICADMWHPELARELQDRIEVLAVPVSSGVPSADHITYARTIWHALALTRALENGFAVAVSDWAQGRHDPPRADGRHDPACAADGEGPRRTHYTSGAACIVDPSHRPNIDRIQRTIPNGESGSIRADIDLTALVGYRDYRRSVGLLPADDAVAPKPGQ